MENYECSMCSMQFRNREDLTYHLVNTNHKQMYGYLKFKG